MKKGLKKNMNKIYYKIKSNLLTSIAIIIVFFSVCIDLIPRVNLDTSIKLFIYCLAIFLIFVNMKIKNRRIENETEKEGNRKEFWIMICLIYSILLLTLLFIDGNYRGFVSVENTGITLFSKEHFEYFSNFVPFKTIYSFAQRLNEGTINFSIVLTNILGNIIAFSPFGIFIPKIFKEKFSDVRKFTLLMIMIVFIVECIQFITFQGSFDIDDLILNVLGSVMMYVIIKIKVIDRVLEKILE